MRIELLIIDPQNTFCYPGLDMASLSDGEKKLIMRLLPPEIINPGALFVPKADIAMTNLAAMIMRLKTKLDDIHVTFDSHHLVDIAHPIFWLTSAGKHPNPFTQITASDVLNGTYRATNPQMQKRAVEYVQKLETNGRYPLFIWPPHGLIGTFGYGVFDVLEKALLQWEEQFRVVDTVTKGSNFWTEHYSAVQADVPDPEDPSTQLNMPLIETLAVADLIPVAGIARSHCLANTARDIANNFGEENIKKMVLLEDATADVPGFEGLGEAFVKEMIGRGMKLSTTLEFMK